MITRTPTILSLAAALLACSIGENSPLDPFAAAHSGATSMTTGADTGDPGGSTDAASSSSAGPITSASSTSSTSTSTTSTTGDALDGSSGDATGDTSSGSSGGPCVPKTCEDKGAVCGTIKDGCGNKIDCGTCGEGEACEGHQCVCEGDACEPGQCHEVADGCGGTKDCGVCDPMVAFCDDNAKQCALHGLQCDGSYDHEDECQFGVNPCKWSCNPIFNNTDQPFIPPCCDVIKQTGDPFACCFDARRVCRPDQCAGIPADVNHERCGQMWANGCCPVATDACPLL